MRLLADTHALLWWLTDDQSGRLSARAGEMLDDADNEIFVSAVSAYEIKWKNRIGKLPKGSLALGKIDELRRHSFLIDLPIRCDHSLLAAELPGAHRNPWDRLLAAQSIVEGLAILSKDPKFEALGAEHVW